MKFSLIVPTINRNNELFKLLGTLKLQTFNSFEVVIVDQNNNGLLSQLNYYLEFSLKNVKVVQPDKRLCASAARNYGAKYAKGEIISFPDDDCWYANNILEIVNNTFKNTEASIVSGGSIDPNLGVSNANFLGKTKFITVYQEIPLAGIEYSVFMYRSIFNKLKFDEYISPGSSGIYQAGEITDLLFKAFQKGLNILYVSDLFIFHPFKKEDFKNYKKEFYYAVGFGYVLKKHKYYLLSIKYLIRSIASCLNAFFMLKFEVVFIRFIIFLGRLVGFILPLLYK